LAAVTGTAPTIPVEQGPVTGSLPPIQHWFFEQKLCDPPLEPGFTAKGAASDCPCPTGAVQQLLEHHDALRLRFIPKSVGSK